MIKKLRITIEGKAYDVKVELLDEGSVSPITEASQPATTPVDAVVPSPLAGKIVSIAVNVGQAVKAGQELITMEAMKMNTHVFAPQDGTIKNILVSEYDAVEEGQPLIEMS